MVVFKDMAVVQEQAMTISMIMTVLTLTILTKEPTITEVVMAVLVTPVVLDVGKEGAVAKETFMVDFRPQLKEIVNESIREIP